MVVAQLFVQSGAPPLAQRPGAGAPAAGPRRARPVDLADLQGAGGGGELLGHLVRPLPARAAGPGRRLDRQPGPLRRVPRRGRGVAARRGGRDGPALPYPVLVDQRAEALARPGGSPATRAPSWWTPRGRCGGSSRAGVDPRRAGGRARPAAPRLLPAEVARVAPACPTCRKPVAPARRQPRPSRSAPTAAACSISAAGWTATTASPGERAGDGAAGPARPEDDGEEAT